VSSHDPFASPSAIAWEAVVDLTATAAAIVVPLALLPGEVSPGVLARAEVAFTVVFAVDAAVRARRAWHVRGRRRRGALALVGVDVLAAVPWTALGGPAALLLVRLLKLFRVVGAMRDVGRHHAGLSARLRLSTFLYGLALVVHALTCGFVALGGVSGSTTPYLDALYWTVMTVTTVGYGDITPQLPVQKVYAIGVMLFGAGVYAFLIGNIASLLSSLDPLRAAHVEQQERMGAFMHYRALPRALQQRVRAYFDYRWEQHLVSDEDATLAELPPALREEVALYLRRDLVRNVPLFRDAGDAFVRDVALQMRSFVCLPGDTVVRAGDRGHEMFFLARGEVEALAPDGAVLRTLHSGDFFGEIALVTSDVRTATVRATTPSDLYVLTAAMFERIAADYPDVAAHVRAEAERRRTSDGAR
jgi:voltage-gated potassium channel